MALAFGQAFSIRKFNKKRALWALGSLALMFGAAYSFVRYLVIGSTVGDWIGLPQYAAQIPRLEREGAWFAVLAVVLPFIAAPLLGFVTAPQVESVMTEVRGPISYPVESRSERWSTLSIRYLLCLGASFFGSLVLVWILFLVSFLLFKLRIHAPI
jgi:hypothetical protein